MAKVNGKIRTGISNRKIPDSAGKLIFSNATLCSQFLRDYSGIEMLKEVKEEDIEDVTTRYVPMFTEERDSDVVKKIRLNNDGCVYIIALIEHKSEVDYNVTMQLLRYMVYIWEDYEKEREAEKKGASRTKEFKYPPILPIVYYEGRRRWMAVTDFKDRILLNDVFEEFIPDYRYKLIRLRKYTNGELIEKNDGISLVMLIDRLKNNDEFLRLRDELPDGYLDGITEKSTDEVLDIIARVVGAILRRRRVSEEEIAEFTDGIKERRMGQLFADYDSSYEDGIFDRGEAQGISKGETISRIRLICKKIIKGKSVSVIADELEEDDESFVSDICRIAKTFAPEYDVDKIYETYNEEVKLRSGCIA